MWLFVSAKVQYCILNRAALLLCCAAETIFHRGLPGNVLEPWNYWLCLYQLCYIQYTPRMVVLYVSLCFLVDRHFSILPIYSAWRWSVLPISFRVTSLALGQSYDCPSAIEATLKDMGRVMELRLSCYLVLLAKLIAKPGKKTAAPPWPDICA